MDKDETIKELEADNVILRARLEKGILAYKEVKKEATEATNRLNKGIQAYKDLKASINIPSEAPKPSKSSINEQIYKAYPRKDDKKRAIVAIDKAVTNLSREGGCAEVMLDIVKNYASCLTRFDINNKSEDWKLVPMPATWFNKERYELDEVEWSAPFRKGKYVPTARKQKMPKEFEGWEDKLKQKYPQSSVQPSWEYFCRNNLDVAEELVSEFQ